MKHIFLQKNGSPALTLFFAGWGMDATPFQEIHPSSSDILLCYDYTRTDDFDISLIAGYEKIRIVAWSFGVWTASRFLLKHGRHLSVSESVAINGTPFPIDSTRGIPPQIFQGTLSGFNDKTLNKFRYRMCGKQYADFMEKVPDRTTDDLKSELESLGQSVLKAPLEKEWPLRMKEIWTHAVIGSDDKIFPAANQQNAWQECGVSFHSINAEHYDAHTLSLQLERCTLSKPLMARRFGKSIQGYDREAFVQHQIADHMISLLKAYCPAMDASDSSRPDIFEFGCGTGFYSKLLLDNFNPNHLWLNDICPELIPHFEKWNEPRISFHAGDAESETIPSHPALVTGCSAIQWFEDPSAFFRKCAHSLSPGGWLAFSSFNKLTFSEVRHLTGQGLGYLSADEYAGLLNPWFQVIHMEESTLRPAFANPMEVLRHLKQTGVTGTGSYRWTRSKLDVFCEQYKQLYSDEAGVRLTYQPIYIVAKLKTR